MVIQAYCHFLSHSLGQTKPRGQPVFKGWVKEFHLLMGVSPRSHYKMHVYGEGWKIASVLQWLYHRDLSLEMLHLPHSSFPSETLIKMFSMSYNFFLFWISFSLCIACYVISFGIFQGYDLHLQLCLMYCSISQLTVSILLKNFNFSDKLGDSW